MGQIADAGSVLFEQIGKRLSGAFLRNLWHLWHDRHRTELAEVLVKGEGMGDAQPLDYNLTRAVGEAPLLVRIGAEDLPGGLNVVFCQIVDVS